MRRLVLLAVLTQGCTASSDADAMAYADGFDLLIRSADVNPDSAEAEAEAFAAIEAAGFRLEHDESNGRYAAATGHTPPRVIIYDAFAKQTQTPRTCTIMHELAHVEFIRAIGRRRYRRLVSKNPTWRVASELPALEQTMECFNAYGQSFTRQALERLTRLEDEYGADESVWLEWAISYIEGADERILGNNT